MEINGILNDIASRRSFLMGLVFIAKADGIIEPEEMTFFQNAAVAMELDEASLKKVNDCWNIEECPPLEFSNVIQKKFFIREAIELSCIDECFADEERALVYKFAAELEVSTSSVEALEKWVEAGMAWKKRGDELIQKAD
jgi:DnaJ-domain-containing protein 1